MTNLKAKVVSFELQKKASKKHKEALQRFFKTGAGEHGEGDATHHASLCD